MFRKEEFKRGIVADERTQKRADRALSLRKQKRDDRLAKRRQIPIDNDNYDKEFNPDVAIKIYSSNPKEVLTSLKHIRKVLSKPKPCTAIIYQLNITSRLMELVSLEGYPEYQYEACWILTNLISGDSSIAKDILDETNLINIMVGLMSNRNDKVRNQAVWCIGNAAGEGINYRDSILKMNGLNMVANCIKYNMNNSGKDDLETSVWVLTNLFRGKPTPAHFYCDLGLDICEVIYKNIKVRSNVLNEFLWVMAYITNDMSDDLYMKAFQIVDHQFLDYLFMNEKMSLPALRTCGNLATGSAEVAQKILDLGFVDRLNVIKGRPSGRLQKEICWILSNIAAGTIEQIHSVISFVPYIAEKINRSTQPIKIECFWFFANFIMGSEGKYLDYLREFNIIEILSRFLDYPSPKVILECLNALEKMLNLGDFQIEIEEYCLDSLEQLQTHPDPVIYEKCVFLIETYY